jgi:hypothetical protein
MDLIRLFTAATSNTNNFKGKKDGFYLLYKEAKKK